MGSLRDFNLGDYNCSAYVETGTGKCVTLGKAMSTFDKCYSVDMDEPMVVNARKRFPTAIIELGLSVPVLESWLKTELSIVDSVLFFLDAHFPGADFYGEPYDVSVINAVPLEEELRLIAQYRPKSKDVIICDDARIYTNGPFQHGNTDWLQVTGGYKFVYDLFPEAKIDLLYNEEGYIVIDKR